MHKWQCQLSLAKMWILSEFNQHECRILSSDALHTKARCSLIHQLFSGKSGQEENYPVLPTDFGCLQGWASNASLCNLCQCLTALFAGGWSEAPSRNSSPFPLVMDSTQKLLSENIWPGSRISHQDIILQEGQSFLCAALPQQAGRSQPPGETCTWRRNVQQWHKL